MEKDERLLPLPNVRDVQPVNQNEPTSYSPIYDEEFDGKRSLREYFNIIYKRLPIILALTLVTTAVTAFYMYRQLSIYEARTEMIIEPRKPKVQSKDAININFGNDVNYYNTQLKLLQNPDLMNEVVIGLNLHRDPNLFSNQNRSFLSTIRTMFSGDKNDQNKDSALPVLTQTTADANNGKAALTPEEKQRAEQYASILLGGMRVVQTPQTNLVNIFVQSTNPALAAKTADMVGEVFIRQDIERETEGSKTSLEELTKSIEELKGTIAGQEIELINFMRSSNLPLGEKGGELSASILQNLSSQWLSAIDERRKIEARYNTAVRANARGEGASIPDLTDSTIYQQTVRLNTERKAKLQDTIREIDRQVSAAETERAQLRVTYTDEYFKIKEKDEQIAKLKETKERTEKEVTQIIEREQQKIEKDAISGAMVGLRAQLESATGRENQLRATYDRELSSANIEGQAATRLTTFKREIETNRGLLDTYIQRQKQMELTVAGSQPDNLKISSHAVTPGGPIGPNRSRNIFIAFLLSLAAGVGLAFLLDYLDDSVKTSDDIGRYLGLPTLALIPYSSESDQRKFNLLNGKTTDNLPASIALSAIGDNRSSLAEAYRHLRTSLLFSSAGKPPQTILVTSAQPAEGKTTTAINTAITLAKSGVNVVIIDCDLRRPRLHKNFGLANATGLTSYLSGGKNPNSLLQDCEGMPNLKVITSGPIPPNPAELLSSNEMKNLLQFLKGNFKHVIIDSPPSVFFTDAAILAMIVDGVVIVALAGKSSIHLTRRFKQRLGSIGARIYGVVLNGIKSGSADYGYYGYNYVSDYYTPNADDDSTPFMDDEILYAADEKSNGKK
ncbi:MAG: polysaccharide biosynthesis tyrosine autokinase [Pyrinomonadaceae bacterium]|nr:polysaccharide biosynthesis tyrosine autokinase [Pyrinomonadaceae bacterium]